MTSRPVLLPLLLALLLVGCGRSELDPRPEDTGRLPDGGTRDGGRPGTETPDVGHPDGGRPDAGRPDAGRPDAGRPDAGRPDGGNMDGGTSDGGTHDGGTSDGGTHDGGTPDGGCVEGWRHTDDLHWYSLFLRAAPLPDGRILVVGGGSSAGNAALFEPATSTFTPTGPMSSPRTGRFTATALRDGRVLVAGGDSSSSLSAELYDPATGRFSVTGALPSIRMYHGAVQLLDGRVLVAGGGNPPARNPEALLWDPATGAWTPTDPMPEHRDSMTLTLLPDGTALAAGGYTREASGMTVPAADAWLYEPNTGRWRRTGSLVAARGEHLAVPLPSGEVLMLGGYKSMTAVPDAFHTRAEVYDWRTGVFTEVSPMRYPRVGHMAAVLPSGEVLVAGGKRNTWDAIPEASEIYSPDTDTWRLVPRMLVPRNSPAPAVLPNGTVLAVDGFDIPTIRGTSSAEIFTTCPSP